MPIEGATVSVNDTKNGKALGVDVYNADGILVETAQVDRHSRPTDICDVLQKHARGVGNKSLFRKALLSKQDLENDS